MQTYVGLELILSVGTIVKWRKGFTTQQIKPLEKRSRYPLNRRPGGLHTQAGTFGGKKNLFPCGESKHHPPTTQPTAQYLYWTCFPAPYFEDLTFITFIVISHCDTKDILHMYVFFYFSNHVLMGRPCKISFHKTLLTFRHRASSI